MKEIYHKEENVFHETNSNIVLSNEISLKAIVREIGLNQFKHTTTRQQNMLDGTYTKKKLISINIQTLSKKNQLTAK